MPQGVSYVKKAEADAYAQSMDGDVMPNPNGDGTFVVVPKPMDFRDALSEGTFKPPVERNMGGTMDDEMGYVHGGMHGKVKKMNMGGAAIKGRNFKGVY